MIEKNKNIGDHGWQVIAENSSTWKMTCRRKHADDGMNVYVTCDAQIKKNFNEAR